jgi:hypothetical protein
VDERTDSLTITARGPAAQGRLPLAEVARLCGEFQATLERIALTLHGATSITGRRPREVVDAVRVEFTGFREGSAVLDLELPAAPDGGALVEEALAVLAAGVTAVRAGAPLPEAFTPQVVMGLLRFAGGLDANSVTEIQVGRGERVLFVADPPLREALHAVRRGVRHADTTIVGLLQMGDFAPSAQRCRIDSVDTSVSCTFDETLAETVLTCLNQLVVASGTGEYATAGGALRSLDLDHLEAVPQPPQTTLEHLVQQQGVRPWGEAPSTGPSGLSEPLSDEEFDQFLRHALSSRGEEG